MSNFTGLKETTCIYYKKNLSCGKRVDEDDICYEWIAIWTLLECSSILQEDGVWVFYQDSMCSLGEVTWHTGEAVNSRCLRRNPQWGSYTDGVDGYKNYIYGAKYETLDLSDKWLPLYNLVVLCSLCLVWNKSVVEVFAGISVIISYDEFIRFKITFMYRSLKDENLLQDVLQWKVNLGTYKQWYLFCILRYKLNDCSKNVV